MAQSTEDKSAHIFMDLKAQESLFFGKNLQMRLLERLASFPACFHFLKKVSIAKSVKPSSAIAASVSRRFLHKSYAVSHQ